MLVGWIVGSDALKSIVPGAMVMNANTAVCFLLMGVGLALLSRLPSASGRRVGLGLIGGSASIAALTLAQYATGIDLGIDRLLFAGVPDEGTMLMAGRMAPLTAVSFALLALAAWSSAWAGRVVLVLCAGALAVSLLNVFSLVFDAAVPPFLAAHSQMAPNTAVTMGLLAIGVVGLLGPANPFTLLTRGTPSASLLRRVLVAVIVVPPWPWPG